MSITSDWIVTPAGRRAQGRRTRWTPVSTVERARPCLRAPVVTWRRSSGSRSPGCGPAVRADRRL